MDHEGTLVDPFLGRVPSNHYHRVHLRVHLENHEGTEGPLVQNKAKQWLEKCYRTFRGARKCILCRMYIQPEKFERIVRSINEALHLHGPLKDQGWPWILWRLAVVSQESLDMLFDL